MPAPVRAESGAPRRDGQPRSRNATSRHTPEQVVRKLREGGTTLPRSRPRSYARRGDTARSEGPRVRRALPSEATAQRRFVQAVLACTVARLNRVLRAIDPPLAFLAPLPALTAYRA